MNLILQNLTDPSHVHDLDDYPNDTEFDYSDYAYEDSTDETTTVSSLTTTTTTTTTTTASTPITATPVADAAADDDKSSDDTKTAYYDYGDHDLYADEEIDETSTNEEPVLLPTTRRAPTTVNWRDRIPFYHRRPPVIWNVNLNDNDDRKSAKHEQRRNSGSSLHYSLLVSITMFISRVWRNIRPVVFLSLFLYIFEKKMYRVYYDYMTAPHTVWQRI